MTVLPVLVGSFCIIGVLVYLEIEAIRDRLSAFDDELQSQTSQIESARERVSASLNESILEADAAWLDRSASALSAHIGSIQKSVYICAKNTVVARYVRGDESLRKFTLENLYNYLDDMIEAHRLSEIVFVDTEGCEFARRGEFVVPEGGDPIWDGYELPNLKTDEGGESWFLNMLEARGEGPIHFDLYKERIGDLKRPVLSVSCELRYDSGRFVESNRDVVGYMQFAIPLDRLLSFLSVENAFGAELQVKDIRTEEILLAGKRGTELIEAGDSVRNAEVIPGLLGIRSVVSTEVLKTELRPIRDMSMGLKKLSEAHDDFSAKFDRANERNRWLLILSVMVLLIITSALMVRLAGRLTGELESLGVVARRVSEGDLSAKMGLPSSVTEFQELAKSIDQMRVRLAGHILDLDAEVANQTKELKERNVQLAQEVETRYAAENLAQQASRAKSEFLATMSHEIRTPLNGIIAMAGKLDALDLPASHREWVDILKVSGESLLSLINDILDFSKIESGRMELEDIPFSVSALRDSIRGMFEKQFAERGIELRIQMDTEAVDWLRGDPNKLRQILINLIGNSLKFTEEGFVRLHLKTSDDPECGLVVEVEDSGMGIPAEAQDRLFHKFVQADSSTTRKHGGTGLGLAIIDRLVNLMGGAIHFSSEEGAGTYFRIQLPLAIATDAEVQKHQELDKGELLSPEEFEEARLLVVDDSVMNLRVVEILLQKYPFEIFKADSGERALEVLENESVDLVLMDCQMPGMDGYEATRRIRAFASDHRNADVPVVALTGNVTEEGRDECDEVGMNGFLSKPVAPEKLLEILMIHLHAAKSPCTKE